MRVGDWVYLPSSKFWHGGGYIQFGWGRIVGERIGQYPGVGYFLVEFYIPVDHGDGRTKIAYTEDLLLPFTPEEWQLASWITQDLEK